MSDTCRCVTLVKRTPIPGPTTGRMHVCQDCRKEWRVEPWGKVSVQMGTQPLAAPDVTKLAEALRAGDLMANTLEVIRGESQSVKDWRAVREALQKLPGRAEGK